jgi:hypothetical protein
MGQVPKSSEVLTESSCIFSFQSESSINCIESSINCIALGIQAGGLVKIALKRQVPRTHTLHKKLKLETQIRDVSMGDHLRSGKTRCVCITEAYTWLGGR